MVASRRPSRMSEEELSRAIGTGKYAKTKEPASKSLEKVGPDKDKPSSSEPNRANVNGKASWKEKIRGAAGKVGGAVSRFNEKVQERHRKSPASQREEEREQRRTRSKKVHTKRWRVVSRIDRYDSSGRLSETVHFGGSMPAIPAKRPRIQAPPQEREERGSWGVSGFDSVGFMESMRPPSMDMGFSGFGLNSRKKGKRNDNQFDYLDYVSQSPFR